MPQTRTTPVAKTLFSEGFLQNPYPAYRRFLEDGPIHYVDMNGAKWAVFRHAECSAIIRAPRLSSKRTESFLHGIQADRQGEFAELTRMLGLWMLFFDPPQHSRLRKLMNKGFSPAVVQTLRPQIETIVDEMLGPLRLASEADIVREVAYPLPVRVIAEMLGVPEELHEYFIEWSDAIAMFLGSPQRNFEQAVAAQEAVLALTEFFRAAVAERRQHKGGDLISLLIDIEEDGEVLTAEELYAQCIMLLFGGHETTRNLIGNGMYTLLRHPESMSELREDPQLIPSAVEELLRYESPVQMTGRIAKEEMDVCGVRLRQGESLVFMLGAANRDSEQFEDPDKLNLKRLRNSHLAFGAGAHFCIGNQLARMEGQIAILRMVQQFPRMKLVASPPEWVKNFGFRGLKRLTVTI